jgi:fatty-acyl-CoA synthase
VALVVLKPTYAETTTGEDLRSFLLQFVDQGTISKWAVPDDFHIVDEIPKTSVGKINKKAIREEVRSKDEKYEER